MLTIHMRAVDEDPRCLVTLSYGGQQLPARHYCSVDEKNTSTVGLPA